LKTDLAMIVNRYLST